MGELQLGQKARDAISGFEGIVMAKAQYLTGVNQILLLPDHLSSDGKIQEGQWFDESQVSGAIVKIKAGFQNVSKPKPIRAINVPRRK